MYIFRKMILFLCCLLSNCFTLYSAPFEESFERGAIKMTISYGKFGSEMETITLRQLPGNGQEIIEFVCDIKNEQYSKVVNGIIISSDAYEQYKQLERQYKRANNDPCCIQ